MFRPFHSFISIILQVGVVEAASSSLVTQTKQDSVEPKGTAESCFLYSHAYKIQFYRTNQRFHRISDLLLFSHRSSQILAKSHLFAVKYGLVLPYFKDWTSPPFAFDCIFNHLRRFWYYFCYKKFKTCTFVFAWRCIFINSFWLTLGRFLLSYPNRLM